MQFDLFEYSRDTGLRNDVFLALEQFDAAAAQRALATLAASFPHDIALQGMHRLIAVLALRDPAPFANHAAAANMVTCLNDIEATAMQLLEGEQGRTWLTRLWRESAQRAQALPFLANESEHHAAALFLRAKDWPAAEKAALAIASWRRMPATLGWVAQARYHMHGVAAIWPLLCELAWMVPSHCDALITSLADPLLIGLRKHFYASFEGQGDSTDLAWFPAWLLITKPALAESLQELQTVRGGAPEQAAVLLRELLGLERRGQHQAIVERRRRLQGLHAGLYAAYMKTR